MSDNYTNPDLDDDDDEADEPDAGTKEFRNMRAKVKKYDAVERENQNLKRELAFTKAGIPMEDPRMGYFVKGYEGDLEPEAIRSAAVQAGFIQIQQQPANPVVEQAKQGQDRVMAASQGAGTQFDLDSVEYAMEQAYREGGIEGLSGVAEQYGVTFQPEEI
jgi:hypothetical protein